MTAVEDRTAPVATRSSALPRWARRLLFGCCLFALVGLGAAVLTFVWVDRSPSGVILSDDGPRPTIDPVTQDVTFIIPAGTAQRQAAGEQVVVLPSRIGIKVGQRLSIRNDDDKAVVIGPFFVAPQEVSTYRFSTPRIIEGACELHPVGTFTVEVRA